MIRGEVNEYRHAVLRFRLFGPLASADVEAVVDTGFTGVMTLPPSAVAALGLVQVTQTIGILADGTSLEIDVYTAEAEWLGTRREVLDSALGDEVLVGMTLLDGHELRIEVRQGGAVEVRPLP